MRPVSAIRSETPVAADTSEYQELVEWLTMKVAEYVNVPPDTIGIDTALADCGIDSVSGLALCADLRYEGIRRRDHHSVGLPDHRCNRGVPGRRGEAQ